MITASVVPTVSATATRITDAMVAPTWGIRSRNPAITASTIGNGRPRAQADTPATVPATTEIATLPISDDETAKTHTRYLVGGRARAIVHEHIFRFEFPERPGALLRFLESLQPDWNITLFHYRYHGADYGRVLAGIEAPPEQGAELRRALDALAYPYQEVTDDVSVRLFLREG